MRSCPYCHSELNRKKVKITRLDGKKWYQHSTEPFFQRVCTLCNKQLVQEYRERWYYKIALPFTLLLYPISTFFGKGLSIELKIVLLLLALVGMIILFKQANDYRYITLEEKNKDKVKSLINYANGHFEDPIESGEYCKKYSLTKNELNKMISLGLIEAYAIDGYDFLNDEAPKNET